MRSGAEAVAHAGFGDEVFGVGGVVFELAAELGQVDPQVAGVLALGGPPDVGRSWSPADQPAVVAHEQVEDAPLGRGQVYVPALSLDDLGGEVDGQLTGFEGLVVGGGVVGGPAERGAQRGPSAPRRGRVW